MLIIHHKGSTVRETDGSDRLQTTQRSI